MNINKKILFGLYDFSNSGYVIMFQTFLFPIFFVNLGGNVREWANLILISNLLAIIIAPIIGKIADLKNRIKVFAALIVTVFIFCSFSLFSIKVLFVAISFLIGNIAFELTQSVYDSFINYLSNDKQEKIALSTFAWGFGYVGGFIFIIIYFLLEKLNIHTEYILLTSIFIYTFISIYSVRLFNKYPKNSLSTQNRIKTKYVLSKNKLISLFIYLIIFIGISSLINFSTLYFKKELDISEKLLGVIMLFGQLIAFPLTIVMGNIAKKYSVKIMIQASIIIWIIGLIVMFFATNIFHIILVVLIFSFVIGTTPSLLRAHYSFDIDEKKMSEQYGYYAIANKSGGVIAPLIVSTLLLINNNMKYIYVIVLVLMVFALFLTFYLKDNE